MSTQYKTIDPESQGSGKKESKAVLIKNLKDRVGEDKLKTLESRQGDLDPETSNRVSGIVDFQDKNNISISESMYHCVTDAPDPLGLQLGWEGGIPRWKKRSTVQFAAFAEGYPTSDQALYAAQMLEKAAKEWNGLQPELGVDFKWVNDIDDAAFVLSYGGDAGSTLARAFFPNGEELSTVYVYKKAFEPGNVNFMKDVFVHELGHVLGLRHEHAPELEGDTVTLGERNRDSVMGYYRFPPKMQESDKKSTKAFYNIESGKYKGWPIKDFVPVN
ncbi:hypothetical protein MW887_009853 [Aspergillus wentii]|nr:hypothetical protein MW887_009853 [Aspergillus wentii]